MKPFRMVAILGIGIACNTAQATDYPNEQDYFQEFPVVLSASRMAQPLTDAPNAMTVIDRNMIVASGFRSITDLFKLVPGMYVSYYKGSQGFVAYHGATDQYSRRMQVMIDGRSVYLPPASMVDWANLPITIDDIERIEVIRGPAAASYGANSTQGVISITTRDASERGRKVSMTRGDKGINDLSVRFGGGGELFDYRVSFAYTADNGYDALTEIPDGVPASHPKALGLLNNSNDSNQARILNISATYHPNSIDRFDFKFGFNHDVQGVGFNDKNSGTNGNPFHDLFSNSSFAQLNWTRALSAESEFTLRYYHIQQNQHEYFPAYLGGTLFPGPITQWAKTGRDEIEAQHTLHVSPSNRLVYGAALRSDRVQAYGDIPPTIPGFSQTYSSDHGMNEWRVFAHDEWRVSPGFLVNAGGMFEHDGLGYEKLSPRLAANIKLAPKQTLRIGISKAHRTPALVEERYPTIQPGHLFIPSEDVNSVGLRPERMLSREIGYLGEFHGGATSLDLRVYSDHLNDGIFVNRDENFENLYSAHFTGLEATLKHSFGRSGEVTFNIAHQRASSNGAELAALGHLFLQSKHPLTNDDIFSDSTPNYSASMLYARRFADDFAFSAGFFYQGALQPFDRHDADYQQAQRRVDLRIAKGFRLGAETKGEAALVVQNLFGNDYTEYIASNVFNRRGYLTLKIDW